MEATELFTRADAALRGVIDRLSPADLDRPVPEEWSRIAEQPVLRDVLFAHAYDEAWVPGVLRGASSAEDDPHRHADLLGDDPVGAYDALHDRASAAVAAGVDPDAIVHFQYGDYAASEGLAHLATYRAFQAYAIAGLVGRPFRLGPELVAGLQQHVVPHVDEWRQWGVFPPPVPAPDGADEETRLLALTGYLQP